jgi:hypothetical protein
MEKRTVKHKLEWKLKFAQQWHPHLVDKVKRLLLMTVDETKITRTSLEKRGWYPKYKSCHTRWCKDGICIDQASDEDYEGASIPEVDKFTYKHEDITTFSDLMKKIEYGTNN